ncbi:MAG TPA: hypothetical protein VHY58_21635 [Streptosporangiaceae bacterium]|jgi:hypothetical protein|nr:hypothetical protein [Streptosporangiaceae bacterium]
MTASVGASFLIALVVVVCLGLFIGIVMWASKRPYFKHWVKPRQTGTGVIGGIHQGDPRSVAPHRDEVVEPVEPEPPGRANR